MTLKKHLLWAVLLPPLCLAVTVSLLSSCAANGGFASSTNGPVDYATTITKTCAVIGDFTMATDVAVAADPKLFNSADAVVYGDVKKAAADFCAAKPADLGAAVASLGIAVADVAILSKDLKAQGVVK